MQRRTTEKVDKENKSTILRNPLRVPPIAAKTVKNEVSTKGRLTAEKPVATAPSSAVKPVSDIKRTQVSKPVTTEVNAAKGKFSSYV